MTTAFQTAIFNLLSILPAVMVRIGMAALIVVLAWGNIPGQSSTTTDSLHALLSHRNLNSRDAAELFLQLGLNFKKEQWLDSSLVYLHKAAHEFTILQDSLQFVKCKNNIAEVYLMQGKNTQASSCLMENIPMAEALQDQESLAQLYNHLGRTANQMGDLDAGLKYYEEALSWSTAGNFDPLTASAYYGIGMNYYGRGDFPKALSYFEQALGLYKKLDNKRAIPSALSAMGNIYYDQGLYTKALQQHVEALNTNKSLDNQFGVASNYSNMANIYFVQENYLKAMEFQKESLQLHEKLGNKTGMATNYYNMALIYDHLGKYGDALKAQLQSLALHEEIQDDAGMIYCFKHLGDLYAQKRQFPVAIANYNKAISMSIAVNDEANRARSLIGLGITQKHLNQLDASRNNIEQGLRLSLDLGIKDATRDAYYQLMTLDSLSGHYAGALKHYRLYTAYKDSLSAESNHQLTREIQAQYETEKKNQEIDLLNKEVTIREMEITRQRAWKNGMLAGVILLVLISLLIYYNYVTRQKLKLQLLRNKIASDLHDDVGSTLSSIVIFSELAKQKSKDITHLLDSIGESSRKMLDAMADIVWTINPENDEFEKIILRMRSFAYELLGARNIEFEFTADDDISLLKLPMDVRRNLYLIFKEATNNLVKYADANKATFAIREERKILSLMIRDNGKGFDMNHPTEGNGIRNMKKRAEEIGGQLLIETQPGLGTTIHLSVSV